MIFNSLDSCEIEGVKLRTADTLGERTRDDKMKDEEEEDDRLRMHWMGSIL